MSKHVAKPVFTFITVILCSIVLTGCIIHVGSGKATASTAWGDDYSSVNKSLTIGEGKTVGDVSAVNGRLRIENNVSADDISSVNGRLSIGDNVSAADVSTVNGKLSAGKNLVATGDVSSVNGGIYLEQGSRVENDVTTVNGTIELDSVEVQRNIETVNGTISLMGTTSIKGDIVYRWNKSNSKYKGRNPVLEIGEDATVNGSIILERPVDLEFANDGLNEKVIRKY